jgi:KUP system potassium uptake protein
MDIFFLVGNVEKIPLGGWFTLAVGVGVLAIMTTWKRGSQIVTRMELDRAIPIEDFASKMTGGSIQRVRGTALFLSPYPHVTPRVLLHHLKHNKVLHEQVIIMSPVTENVPAVPRAKRVEIQKLESGFVNVVVHHGFMQSADMRDIREQLIAAGINLAGEISYYIGHMTLRMTGHTKFPLWRKMLFAFLFHNERSASAFLGIPPNRVVELGEQAEI